jgi:hypothetical protein
MIELKLIFVVERGVSTRSKGLEGFLTANEHEWTRIWMSEDGGVPLKWFCHSEPSEESQPIVGEKREIPRLARNDMKFIRVHQRNPREKEFFFIHRCNPW